MLLLQELVTDSSVVPEKLGEKYYHWFLDFKMFLRQNHRAQQPEQCEAHHGASVLSVSEAFLLQWLPPTAGKSTHAMLPKEAGFEKAKWRLFLLA